MKKSKFTAEGIIKIIEAHDYLLSALTRFQEVAYDYKLPINLRMDARGRIEDALFKYIRDVPQSVKESLSYYDGFKIDRLVVEVRDFRKK